MATTERVPTSTSVDLVDADGNPTGDQEELSTTFSYDFPETIEEAVKMWGEDPCLDLIHSSARVKAQNAARNLLGKKSDEEIQAEMDEYVPTISRRQTLTMADRASRLAEKAKSPEEIEAAIAALKELLAANGE